MNEDTLVQLSHEIDELLLKTAEKYDVGFMSLSAVFLARLAHISYELGIKEDFSRLLETAKYTVLNEVPHDANTVHSGAVH